MALGLQLGIYSSDYYSGVQAGLYIGDVFIDELVSWRYELRQSKTPIYGYASQLFDVVAPGVKIVEGGFSVNFRESGYLYLVLKRYKDLQDQINSGAIGLAGIRHANRLVDPLRRRRYDPETRATIERILSGEATRDERRRAITSIALALGRSSENFEADVAAFEDSIWERKGGDLDLQGRMVDDNIFDDVDIYLTFGDITNPDPAVKSTVRRIRGVHFTGQGQEIVATGEPVLEYYTFIGRNIV